MKDLTQLFKLVAKAVEQNKNGNVVKTHWFIKYSGHVNTMDITYYPHGWSINDKTIQECLQENMDEDGIQSAYWFIKSRLEK